WWKDLGLAKELEFARDEPIKWYMWPMACLPDPRLSEERIQITQSLSLIYILDDLFDCHGNINELTLFTDVVKRWDLATIEQLPECMKVCFKALYDITNEFALRTYSKHGWNPITSLIKSLHPIPKTLKLRSIPKTFKLQIRYSISQASGSSSSFRFAIQSLKLHSTFKLQVQYLDSSSIS
ncbi:wound-inducible putative chloroplast terpene synthase 3, partial [Trifolium medium]|nr:wound-inducible putative chloroplast terpene synthase 3 [Trifolium medium]